MSLKEFRIEKNEFFRTSPDSPLTSEQKENFSELNYFPENNSLIFDLEINKNLEGESLISMQTSSGDSEPYKRYGKIAVSVNNQKASLTIFKAVGDNELFLPFKDTTSGKETYDSGRYVEVEEENGKLKVDFNYSYNPNCAYNPNWRCPLTPLENSLKVPIEAGEKKFHK